MTKARRSFTDEFKREAVALLQTSGRPLMQIRQRAGHSAVDVAQVAQWGREGACGGIAAPQYAGGSPAGWHAR
jgi:transposase